MSRGLRAFFGSLFITLILMGFFAGFLAVDASTATYGLGDASPIALVERRGELVVIEILGNRFGLLVEPVNEAVGFVERYAPLFLPRPLRLAAQGITLGVQSYGDWQEAQREREYREAVGE